MHFRFLARKENKMEGGATVVSEVETTKPELVPNLRARLTDILARKSAAGKRKADVEQRVQNERINLAVCAEKRRVELLPYLTDGDGAVIGWAQGELDAIDRDILERRRLVEALESELAKATAEYDAVRAEHKALDQEVEAAEKTEKFEKGKKQIAARLDSIAVKLDELRLLLGDAVMNEFVFAEEFGAEGNRFLTFEHEKFQRSQDVGNRFHEVWGWNPSQMHFFLKPMQKNSR